MLNSEDKSTLEKKPPFFKSWKQIYQLVIGIHAVMILLLYWFTSIYS